MADNLGGLFDSDPGFLEELASGTNETVPNVPQQPQMPGVIPQNSGQLPQGMMQPGHPHPGYNMAGMQQQPGAGYGGMQFQTQQPQTQQFSQQNFNQYNNQQQVYNQNMVSTPSQKQGHLNQNPMMSPTHRNQFASPPSGMMHQGQVMYQYNAASAGQAGPRLPNPAQQQQIKMAQMQGWNQNSQMFNPQQQQQQSKQQQQQQYLQQHQSNSNMQGMRMQVPFSGAQPGQNQTIYMQRVASSGINRMPVVNASQPSSMGMSQQMYQHGNQNFNNMNISQTNIPSDPMRVQQPQQYMHQQQTNQQFPQQQQQQQQQQQFQFPQIQQQNLTDNCVNTPQQQQNMLRFPQTSPTLPNVQQRLPFNNMNNMNAMSQPRANVPMLSPRPTPPPPSPSVTPGMLSPTGSTSSHQGGFGSMEPSPNHPQQQNSANMFQPSAEINDKQNFSQFSQNTNQMPSQNISQTNGPNASMHVTVNTNINSIPNQSQCSPVKKVVSPSSSVTSPSSGNLDIQGLNQQIQQLYSMPQTPQTQQKILDLQEKVQLLKSQQMQQSPRPSPQQIFQSPPGQVVSQPLPSPKQAQSTVQASQAVPPLPQMSNASNIPTSQMVQSGTQVVPQSGSQMLPQSITQIPQSGSQVVQKIPQVVQIGQNGSQMVQPGMAGPQIVHQRPPVVQPGQMVRLVQSGPGNSNNQQKIFIIQQQPGQRMPNPSQQQPQQQPLLSQSQTVLPTQVPTLTSLPQPVLNGSTQPGQQLLIKPSQAGPGNTPLLIQNSVPVQPQTNNENSAENSSLQQEKANKIIAEAIAKAQKSGNSTIPRVLQPPDLPATLGDLDNPEQETPDGKTPKKKRKYTPRKETGEKGEKKPRSKKKKGEKAETVTSSVSDMIPLVAGELTLDGDSTTEAKTDTEVKEEKEKKPKKKKEKGEKKSSEKTPKTDKKRPKKPPATFLKNKKRKRRGSSDGSDIEIKITPPPSPENDEFKRRSGRNVKRKKYMDDVDLNLSDEDTLEALQVDNMDGGAVVKPENPAEEDAVIVDKILGSRMRKPDPDEETDMEESEEFFVKYKNLFKAIELEGSLRHMFLVYMRFKDNELEGSLRHMFLVYMSSYLHCEWRTEAEIRDKRIPGKIKRFKMKQLTGNDVFNVDDEFFNPDYVEVDRVLEESHTIDPNTQEEVTHFLVKWRSLPYEDSTWELQQDVDPEKVKQFKIYRELPPEEERGYVERPKSSEWKALKETHTYKNENTLREYQLEGVNWLTFNWHKKQNCILADEMGLGKTIQSITFLQEIFNYGIRGPFLVVAPLSTIANWQREFETWTDINAITYHGTSPSRYMLQEYEMYYRDEEGGKITDFYKFHALITTYEIILSDLELLRTIDWRCIIIDEAHRLKNKNCSLIKGLRIFEFEHKVLLSGTPLQNNVEELFSLLNFLEPSQFQSSDAFLAEFGKLQTEEQVEKLKAILKPMMLRRLKEDVEKNIARKEETIIEVELTNIQKKYYRAILEKNFSYLCKGANSTNVPSLLNTMMELRKCCNHPYLLNGAEENILSELRAKENKEPEHIQALVHASGKFVLLDKLLPRLKQGGHRVLIFSQMIRVLDIIEDYLIHKKYLYERLDGRIRGNLRQEAIDRYSKPDSDRFVFLICTKAGGLGINLTAADTVIIYDSDWNPQNDLQAQARCHRIGQSKMVQVYRLITRNSYEREMFNRASMKLGLDKAVLQSMGGEKISPQQQLTKREIEDLLRKGAYGALMDDDSAGDKFCEEDIEQILKGRTQVIQIESEGKGSTFSKASFSATSNRDDIDINDPEFWQKWAKKADVDTEMLDTRELIVDEPRVRKRTARYGNNDSLAEISDLGSESDSDEDGSRKGKKGRRGRRGDDDEDFEKERHRAKPAGTGYGRSELFKVEKGLLHYGWGRWSDILAHSRFKRHMEEKDVENVAKAILLYGLQYYKGDERIKEFISDLISQEKEGGLKNHSGLSAPVPRGRKGKKSRDQEVHFDANEEIEKAGIKMDRDIVYNKNAYKRHIHRHSNKVLLRVRTLFYLKHEVLGDAVDQIDQGKHVKDITLTAPIADSEPPTFWWDELSDKSLLVGVYKHGYEKYNLMRQDPMLVFLERCGPPDNAALAAEMKDDDDNEGDDMDEASILKDEEDEESLTCASDAASTPKRMTPATMGKLDGQETEDGKLPFPTISEMNTRLRRIITSYQRDFKKQQLKKEQQAKKMEKREKLDAVFREREQRRRQTQMKWTRREETDFYRIVSTYGIEFDRHKGRYIWDKFRVMARLEKKTDEQLTEYFISFYHMCLRVCRKIKEEAYPPTPVYIEPITEERANRCIARIDLLSKIREEIIVHPKMDQRVKLCQKSLDLPSWWNNGRHDRELLVGAAKHGLARTDYYIMNDEKLTFLETIKSFIKTHSNSPVDFKLFGKDLDKKGAKVIKDEKSKHETAEEKSDEKCDSEKDKVVKDEQTNDSAKTEKDAKEIKDESSPKKDDDSAISLKRDKYDSDTDTETGAEVDDIKEKSENVKSEDNEDVEVDKKEDLKVKEEDDETSDSVNTEKVKLEKLKEEEKPDVKKEVKVETNSKVDPDEEVRQTMEGEESQSDLLNSVSQTLLAQWPKDRVVFHRLEQICYCIETGEWPFPPKMKNVHILGIDSSSNTPTIPATPTRSLTPLTPKLDEESKDSTSDRLTSDKQTKREKDFEVQLAEGEGLKMTFHKKAEKNKRSADAMEAEKAARIQAILAQSIAASQASSDDSQQDSILSSTSQVSWPAPWLPSPPPFQMMVPPQGGSESPFLNGGHMSEEELMMNRHLLEQGLLFPRQGRRGRKRKEEKMAEIAMAEALARRQTARALACLESDSRVPVINLEDGSRLSGDDAPLKKNLEGWLEKHPGYMVDSRVEELEEGEIVSDFPERRKGRKPKFDPAFLEVDKLTGEENVSVINRLTGKKITGAKAPPLRYLAEWLEQNPMWDVDPKWSELVRAKGSLPKTLLPRIVTPSRRGRKPRDSPLSHPVLGTSDPHQAAAIAASMEAMNAAQLMAAGFGKLPLPFGSIPGLGQYPMLGLQGFGFPGMSASPVPEKSESKHKETKGSKEDGEKPKEDEKSSSPHPSFPLMYNPLLFNPALLAAQGMANFTLPTSLAGMESSLINGHTPAKEETATSSSSSGSSRKSRHVSEYSEQNLVEDLSVRSKSKPVIENTTEAHSCGKSKPKMDASFDGDDMPCDLSMKPKAKEEKSKQKICSSDKLSRIVDTLKFRVNKMDEKPQKGDSEKDSRRHSIDAVLNLSDKSNAHSSREQSESSSLRKDLINSLSKHATSLSSSSSKSSSLLKSSSSSLLSSSSSSNHAKEPVPKIVQELLAAKQQREREELLVAKQLKLDAIALKQPKLLKDSPISKPKSSSSQGLDVSGGSERDTEVDSEKS